MTVVDTSCLVDLLLGEDAAGTVLEMMAAEGEVAAPEIAVFETLSVLRRHVLRGDLRPERAAGAVEDLGELPVGLYPTMPLRTRVWALRDALTPADALFVALSEVLDEPLATKDHRLARATRALGSVQVIAL